MITCLGQTFLVEKIHAVYFISNESLHLLWTKVFSCLKGNTTLKDAATSKSMGLEFLIKQHESLDLPKKLYRYMSTDTGTESDGHIYFALISCKNCQKCSQACRNLTFWTKWYFCLFDCILGGFCKSSDHNKCAYQIKYTKMFKITHFKLGASEIKNFRACV